MRALLQMTMETEDTTERLSAPTVPSWNFSPPNPISTVAPTSKQSGVEPKTSRPKGPNHAAEAEQHLRNKKDHVLTENTQ